MVLRMGYHGPHHAVTFARWPENRQPLWPRSHDKRRWGDSAAGSIGHPLVRATPSDRRRREVDAVTTVTPVGMLTAAQVRTVQLYHVLHSRIAIEQAKGVLDELLHLEMSDAFQVLRGHARHNHLRLADMARGGGQRRPQDQ
jgi:hypothetical protein